MTAPTAQPLFIGSYMMTVVWSMEI